MDPGDDRVALPVDVFDAEARVDRGLVRVGGGAVEIVEGEACEEVILGA